MAKRGGGRAARWAGTAATAAAFTALTLVNVDALVLQTANPAEPALGPRPAVMDASLAVTKAGEQRTLGPCWRREHRRQHVFYFEGSPLALGYCNSRLAGELLDRQEAALQDAMHRFLPSAALRYALPRALAWIYRHLPQHMSQAERREILGVALGYEDKYRYLAPTFGRVVYYHAIHDITQALVDNPIIACSAFAATGARTRDGHTLLARVFDFEGGRVFDEDKAVIFVRPDYGIPFVSVVWMGMVGAVSGMNAAGVGVVLNAAGSDHVATRGTPSTLVVRAMLQHARSVDDAIAIARSRRVFVSDILTVADGKTGELAVIEMTPGGVAVRRRRGAIYATNHLLARRFQGDRENAARKRDGTTMARYRRLALLVDGANRPLDPRRAQSILRDRTPGATKAPAPLGHRSSIDALIAAHAVVFDLTARKVWVSAAPHTLGAFVAYDLREVLAGRFADLGALPADPLLKSGGWTRYQRARKLMRAAADAVDDEPRRAVTLLRKALALVPRHPEALLSLARACEAVDETTCAVDAYRAFIAGGPPNEKNARLAKQRLGALGSVEPAGP